MFDKSSEMNERFINKLKNLQSLTDKFIYFHHVNDLNIIYKKDGYFYVFLFNKNNLIPIPRKAGEKINKNHIAFFIKAVGLFPKNTEEAQKIEKLLELLLKLKDGFPNLYRVEQHNMESLEKRADLFNINDAIIEAITGRSKENMVRHEKYELYYTIKEVSEKAIKNAKEASNDVFSTFEKIGLIPILKNKRFYFMPFTRKALSEATGLFALGNFDIRVNIRDSDKDTVEYILTHELGHLLHEIANSDSLINDYFEDAKSNRDKYFEAGAYVFKDGRIIKIKEVDRENNTIILDEKVLKLDDFLAKYEKSHNAFPTYYSLFNRYEFFAECFAHMLMKTQTLYHPLPRKMIKEVIEKAGGKLDLSKPNGY